MALLGSVTIPSNAPSGTFPLTVDFGFTTTIAPPFTTHTFKGAGDIKRTQRYLYGTGARQWNIQRSVNQTEHDALLSFWESHSGPTTPFTFNCPLEDGTTTAVTCCFANQPLVTDYQPGLVYGIEVVLIEVYTGSGPTYSITSTVERVPNTTLNSALTSQHQQLIKLVTIRPRLSSYPPIYMADQLCTIGGITYQPRLLRWEGIGQVAVGMPGVSAESDDVTLVFGNADRVMRQVADSVQLDQADVQISFFHVQSGVLCNFWAGQIIVGGWQSNSGPEFTVHASDPLASPFLLCPPRIIDRRCNKLFNDANECPFAVHGAMDYVNYPSASPTSCDHGYDTENGCLAHGMGHYFNGLLANPQGVRVKDNSTGIFGLFRDSVVASSIIDDSAWGHAIPIIVTSISLPVPAVIIAVRDEGDFLRALGVVGEGPLQINQLSTLDGFLNHGYPGPLGFRSISGIDPVTSDGDAMEMFPFPAGQPLNFSAGTAAVEILVKDTPGIQPSTPAQHALEAIVDSGWKGWAWDPTNTRTGPFNLTNVAALAANLYLLCKKLFNAPAATQEAYLDIPALVAAENICNQTVTRTVELDEGLETQWLFIGAIKDQKPLRDVLSDVLLNCLGNYTFKNGKLSISCRENAAATVAYTDGNIIWRSLSLAPLGPQFTRLTATFADREYGFVANTATYPDDDYAQELGGGSRALHTSAQMNLSGTCDISPATRFVVTRAREEIGGVNAAERKAARRVTWRTSALGFDTSPGDVASITHEDMPGGFGKVRVERWKLIDDWTIELTGRTVTDSMYDMVAGPKPADVRPDVIPSVGIGGFTHQAVWMPNLLTASSLDPLYTQTEKTFSLLQKYSTLADGTPRASLVAGGDMPVTNPSSTTTSVPAVATVTQSPTGGYLLGGTTYFVNICAQRATLPSPGSIIIAIFINSGTNTNKITLSDITWPTAPTDGGGSWDGYTVFAAAADRALITEQFSVTGALPASIDLTGNSSAPILLEDTYAPPNAVIKKIRLKTKLLIHNGVSPGIITEVGTNTIRCMHLASDRSQDTNPTEGGITWGADPTQLALDDWSPASGFQRYISIIARASDNTSPLLNFTVTGYDHTSGTFTVTPDPLTVTAPSAVPQPGITEPGTSAPGAPPAVGGGDIFVVRFVPQWSVDGLTFSDPGMINGQYKDGTPPDRIGHWGRVIHGPGKGQTHVVAANDATSYTFDKPFVGVDSTSLIIIEASTWLHSSDSQLIDVSSFGVHSDLEVSADNLLQSGVVAQAVTVDSNGTESDDSTSPTRETWIYGQLAETPQGLVGTISFDEL